MNRVEIEIELHRGRAETLEWITSLSEEELMRLHGTIREFGMAR